MCLIKEENKKILPDAPYCLVGSAENALRRCHAEDYLSLVSFFIMIYCLLSWLNYKRLQIQNKKFELSCQKAFSSPWQVVMKYVNLVTIYLGSGKMPETLQTMLISIFELILSLRQKSFPFGCHHCGVLYEKKKKNGAGFLELSEYSTAFRL